jgi:hypothetical protein
MEAPLGAPLRGSTCGNPPPPGDLAEDFQENPRGESPGRPLRVTLRGQPANQAAGPTKPNGDPTVITGGPNGQSWPNQAKLLASGVCRYQS